MRLDAATFLRNSDNVPKVREILSGRIAAYFPVIKPIVRREFLQAHALRYDPACKIGEDFDLHIRCLLEGASVVIVPEAYYVYTLPYSEGVQDALAAFAHGDESAAGAAQRGTICCTPIAIVCRRAAAGAGALQAGSAGAAAVRTDQGRSLRGARRGGAGPGHHAAAVGLRGALNLDQAAQPVVAVGFLSGSARAR